MFPMRLWTMEELFKESSKLLLLLLFSPPHDDDNDVDVAASALDLPSVIEGRDGEDSPSISMSSQHA